MSLSIFKYFGHVIQKTFFSYLHCINETSNTLNYYIPDQRRKETLVTRLTWLCLPPPPLPPFTGFSWEEWEWVQSVRWVRGRRKKVHLKRWLPQLSTQCSSPRYFGKGVVKDACLRKFSQGLIVNGCLIAKVVPDNNELVLNNDEQMPNNDGLITKWQVPNNKNQ